MLGIMANVETEFFRLLPTEIVVSILEQVPCEDLLSCTETCHSLRTLIRECVSLQYKIELAAAGMEDNRSSLLSKAEKLSQLRHYRQTWARIGEHNQKFTAEVVPIHEGPAWEFTGGVLAQSVGKKAIEFKQLPSSLRGIKAKTWTTELGSSIVDFTADPGQDLLVTIQAPRKKECKVRFLSMSTGNRHREARKEVVSFERNSTTRPTTHEIRISGSYVGVLMKEIHSRAAWCHISVWDWRTGETIFAITHPYWSFCFLDEHYLLLADFITPTGTDQEEGTLVALDLNNPQERWSFKLPICVADVTSVYSMELLCEPGSRYTPPPNQDAPFHISRENRLVVLIMHITDDCIAEDYAITFSMLASRILACMHEREDEDRRLIHWPDWGEQNCRAEFTPVFWEGIWPCCVYGMKHVVQEEGCIVIHDYNPHAIQERIHTPDGVVPDGETLVTEKSWLEEGPFGVPVLTSLPYRKIKTNLKMSEIDSVMLSEDSIVVVADEEESFYIKSL